MSPEEMRREIERLRAELEWWKREAVSRTNLAVQRTEKTWRRP